MKQILLAATAVVALLAFPACKKETAAPGQNPVPPATEKPQVAVVLEPAYLADDKVDSAVAVWETGGRKQTVQLIASNDSLLADVNSFAEGNGKFTIKIYSALKLQNQYKLQWLQEKQLSIKHNASISMSGPADFLDADWKPRVALEDGVGNFAVVALRPEDPYFYIKEVKDQVKKLVVFRGYWQTKGGPQQIAGREWQCDQGCIDQNRNVENSEFFKFLPTQIGTRAWNHIEIIVLYNDSDWGGYVLSLNHTVN